MNSMTMLGLACVDKKFRDDMFGNAGIVENFKVPLTWKEQKALEYITTRGADSSDLKQKLKAVGDAIDAMVAAGCPDPPCQWPRAFTVNDNTPPPLP